MRRSTSFALRLLLVVVAVLISTCSASFSIRVGYTQADLVNGVATSTAIDNWSIRDSSADPSLSCLPPSSAWSFELCDGAASCSAFTNTNMTGFNSAADPAWSDPNNLPFFNRIPIECASAGAPFAAAPPPVIGCSLPAPEPVARFECVGVEWRPKCLSASICYLDGDVVITNQTVGIQQKVEISGNFTNSGTGRVIVRVMPLTTGVGLNISGCAESTTPFLIDTANIGPSGIRNSTIIEYAACGGAGADTPLGTELAGPWSDCGSGYSRSVQSSEENGRVSLNLVFTPVSPTQCNSATMGTPGSDQGALPMPAIIGIAVGAVGVVLVVLLIVVFAVPSIRARLFPFLQRRDEEQKDVRMSTIQS